MYCHFEVNGRQNALRKVSKHAWQYISFHKTRVVHAGYLTYFLFLRRGPANDSGYTGRHSWGVGDNFGNEQN